ncbi:MAG: hypothetical protein U9Q06_01265 [Nanoarchaeota archaeon]|nr:hypothetical protein [Nanoarchaeota archaeon]
MKKLKQILSKKQLKKIKEILISNLEVPTQNWSHAMSKKRIEGLLGDIGKLSNPLDLWQLQEFIPKENKKVIQPLNEFLKEECFNTIFPFKI